MPYIDDMRRFLVAVDCPLDEDNEQGQDAVQAEEELESFLTESAEEKSKTSTAELLDELRTLADKLEWQRSLNESKQYTDGYEMALVESADKIRDIIKKYDEGY